MLVSRHHSSSTRAVALLVLFVSACTAAPDTAKGAGAPDAGSPRDAGGQGDDTSLDAQVSNSDCKRGIAHSRNTVAGLEALSRAVHWWYNWTPSPEEAVASSYPSSGVAFVPMVWGGELNEADVLAALPSDAAFLLGFHEPNVKSGANLSAAEAAFRWPTLEKVADDRGLRLVSPAVTFCAPESACHDTDPFAYLDAFFALCEGCRVDYVAAHWSVCDASALAVYLKKLRRYQRPIWLTELACGDADQAPRSVEEQKRFMEEALAVLELDPWVARYAWFADDEARSNVGLVDEQGALSELGQHYVSLPHYDVSCAR